jgi:GT2 family glycosyltransferase
MPAYNAAATIAEAIASVQAQTWTDWELVIVDDGSTDSTLAMAQQVATADNRIRVVASSHSGSLAHVRNVGIQYSQADLLAFLDSDDTYEPDTLHQLYTYLQQYPDCNLVYGQYILTDAANVPLRRQPKHIQCREGQFYVSHLPEHTWLNILTSRVSNQMQGVLVRRPVVQHVEGFPETPVLWCPDFVFFVRVCLYDLSSVHALPMIAFRYRQLPGSMTGSPAKLHARLNSIALEMNAIFASPAIPKSAYQVRRKATAVQYFHRVRPVCTSGRFQDIWPVFTHAWPRVGSVHALLLLAKSIALWSKHHLFTVP